MAVRPDPQLHQALSALLFREQGPIAADWAGLVRETQPALFARTDASQWAERTADALGALQIELASPERLRFPVLGGREHDGMRALAVRAIAGATDHDRGLHAMQGVYFLLQEAMVRCVEAHMGADERVPAVLLVDRFIKQLSTAMAEATTQRYTHGLESAVEERTWHLRESLRKEGEFLGFISHEVRTGLTAILGACDFLREISEEDLSPTQDRYVRLIESSGELIHALVNDILDYAKLDSGRVELRLEPVNLREVATDTLALLESKWAPKGLDMELAIPAELPDVSGDRIRLQQIFLNLVANAIRFSPEGGKVVLRGGQSGPSEWVEVLDEGPGVPESDRTRIFDRFQQLENAFNRGEGTGLGLPIVKLLTEMHGGHVEVLTPPQNAGGLFRVSLPVMSPDLDLKTG
jgi:signal transduction histidine kinase